jgi:hypothetical protein
VPSSYAWSIGIAARQQMRDQRSIEAPWCVHAPFSAVRGAMSDNSGPDAVYRNEQKSVGGQACGR